MNTGSSAKPRGVKEVPGRFIMLRLEEEDLVTGDGDARTSGLGPLGLLSDPMAIF